MIYVKAGDYKGTYFTVWEIKEERGFVKGKIGSSSKKQDDTYENSNWFVDFGKNCKEKALTLKEKDRILVKDFLMKNIYNVEAKKAFLTFSIQSFDIIDGKTSDSSPKAEGTKFPKAEAPIKKIEVKDDSDDSLPFDL